MARVIKSISLTSEIAEDIDKRTDKYGFNFSAWIRKNYAKQFLNIETKKLRIQEYQDYIKHLEKEINEISDRRQAYHEGFNRNEKRYLKSIPRLLSEGKDWKGLKNRFNLSFKRDMTMRQFKKLVDYFRNRK